MTKKIKRGDWIVTPEFNYEVRVTGRDTGTGELIVKYVLDNGSYAYKTVPVETARLFVEA